tara:strand:- start:5430 stop:5660 length:231 start_codon:yes stop_codon:yes gene_type:complete
MSYYGVVDLKKDPAFWKSLKRGDNVCGREVFQEAKDTACGWPRLDDLMSDEGTSWMVCRAGFDHPACGCPHEEVDA